MDRAEWSKAAVDKNIVMNHAIHSHNYKRYAPNFPIIIISMNDGIG